MAELPIEGVMGDEDEGAEIIYCRYGQCADRVIPCPSCIVLPADADEETIEAAIAEAAIAEAEKAEKEKY